MEGEGRREGVEGERKREEGWRKRKGAREEDGTKESMYVCMTINKPHFLYIIDLDVMQNHPLQETFQSIPVLISHTRVTRRWGLHSHAQNVVRWLAC